MMMSFLHVHLLTFLYYEHQMSLLHCHSHKKKLTNIKHAFIFFLWDCNNSKIWSIFSSPFFQMFLNKKFVNLGFLEFLFVSSSSHSISFRNILHLSFWINVFSFSLEPSIFHTRQGWKNSRNKMSYKQMFWFRIWKYGCQK